MCVPWPAPHPSTSSIQPLSTLQAHALLRAAAPPAAPCLAPSEGHRVSPPAAHAIRAAAPRARRPPAEGPAARRTALPRGSGGPATPTAVAVARRGRWGSRETAAKGGRRGWTVALCAEAGAEQAVYARARPAAAAAPHARHARLTLRQRRRPAWGGASATIRSCHPIGSPADTWMWTARRAPGAFFQAAARAASPPLLERRKAEVMPNSLAWICCRTSSPGVASRSSGGRGILLPH
jgi:hypothetical protein